MLYAADTEQDKTVLEVKMTIAQAKALGIYRCSSCGWPENNHFDRQPRTCAHTDECTGFVGEIRLPNV